MGEMVKAVLRDHDHRGQNQAKDKGSHGLRTYRERRSASIRSVRAPAKANADNPPWIKALAEVRRLAPREGWRYQHVQAIIVAIDQYAEAALGNREFFLNKPYGIGGGRTKNNIP